MIVLSMVTSTLINCLLTQSYTKFPNCYGKRFLRYTKNKNLEVGNHPYHLKVLKTTLAVS